MKPRIRKITVNIGAGEGGDKLQRAENLLEKLTGQKPVRTFGKATIPAFNVKKKGPMGTKVTLRGKSADEFLKKALDACDNTIKESQIDATGNVSLGVHEYIDMPGTEYDPDIGMYGMDVAVNLERPGYRIGKRRRDRKKVPAKERITKEETIAFLTKKYGVKIE